MKGSLSGLVCCRLTYRRQPDRRPGNSRAGTSYNCRWANSQHGPSIGRYFATFGSGLRSSDHFSGECDFSGV
jgi:hypothetical protein